MAYTLTGIPKKRGPKTRGFNPRLAEIVSRCLGSASLIDASKRLDFALNKDTLRSLRLGKPGREATVRIFAEGFAEELLTHYGAEVEARQGEQSPKAAADWLASVVGFEMVPQAPRTPVTLIDAVQRLEGKLDRIIELLESRGGSEGECFWCKHPIGYHQGNVGACTCKGCPCTGYLDAENA